MQLLGAPVEEGGGEFDREKSRRKLVESLEQTANPNGPEPAIHILANAQGQREWHRALAEAFAPDGVFAMQFTRALTFRLPEIPPERVASAAGDFLGERYRRAREVELLLTEPETVIHDAIARSQNAEKKQRPDPVIQSGFVQKWLSGVLPNGFERQWSI